jgi:hypothetical protein
MVRPKKTQNRSLQLWSESISAHAIPILGIIEMRHGMWEKVASRSHKPSMIYTFGKGGDDVMLHGTVDYELKDGKRAEGIEWAARARFGAEEGGLKMVFYQVYLVSGPFFLCLVLKMGLRGGRVDLDCCGLEC